jgi:hypothetical protein
MMATSRPLTASPSHGSCRAKHDYAQAHVPVHAGQPIRLNNQAGFFGDLPA